jgi:HSP20 family protein
MTQETRTDVQKVDQEKVPAMPELTRSGPVYLPAVDIFESEASIIVLADMPGVKPQDLQIDLRDSVLTLRGRMAPAGGPGERSVLREYDAGTFFRQFTLGETIEQARIDAKLTDGVLRLELPKLERAKPRQIAVKAG